jgi:hypothetical protein
LRRRCLSAARVEKKGTTARRLPSGRIAQPRCSAAPASDPSPTGPALRANPSPEVTDPARGCSPWRPAADMGTVRCGNQISLPRIFKGRRERSGHRKSRGALQEQHPSLRASRFQGVRPLQRKENSSRGPRRQSPSSLRVTASDLTLPLRGGKKSISASGFGNINPIPFRSITGQFFFFCFCHFLFRFFSERVSPIP